MARKFFQNHTISDLSFDKKELFSLQADANLEEALKTFTEKKVLSLPVFNFDKYCGTLSLFDVMMYIAFGPTFRKELDPSQLQNVKMDAVHVKDLLGLSDEGKIAWLYHPTEPLSKLLDPFSLGVHRVLVREHDNDGNAVFRTVSQTDLVAYIQKHSDELKDVLQQDISALGLANPSGGMVITMPSTETALQGFQRLTMKNVNAVAVVDQEGKIVGTLSASDCRGLNSSNLADVLKPVLEYLKSRGSLAVPVSSDDKATLLDVALKMSTAKVHRVWILNSAQQPIGVVTQSDVIHAFRYV